LVLPLAVHLVFSALLAPYLDVTGLFNFTAGLVAFLFVMVTILVFIFVYDNLRREKKTNVATV
jgi:hypothetical protein